MKYKKPQGVRDWMNWHGEKSAHAVAHFLDSLPSEFEILGPGERAVVWPDDLTRERLKIMGDQVYPSYGHITDALRALATIAPEAPKKRRVVVYENSGGKLFAALDGVPVGQYWTKRGELEIEG